MVPSPSRQSKGFADPVNASACSVYANFRLVDASAEPSHSALGLAERERGIAECEVPLLECTDDVR